MKTTTSLFALAALVLLAGTAFSQTPGNPYFIAPQVSAGGESYSFTALQPDGRVLLANAGIRVNADGTIDNTYAGVGIDGILSVQADSTGAIDVLSSVYQNSNGTGPLTTRITRCIPHGNSFVPQILYSSTDSSLVYSGLGLIVQPDNKVIFWSGSGSGIPFGSIIRQGITRINLDGSLDTSFDPGFGPSGPNGPNYPIATVVLQSDGKILVGGYFTMFDKKAAPGLVRLNTDGTVDATFNLAAQPSGFAGSDVPTAILELSNNQVLIYGGISRQVLRFNSDGSFDVSLGKPSGGSADVYALALQPDGKILIGGGFTQFADKSIRNLARLNADGTLDASFNLATMANLGAGDITSIGAAPDGHIYFGARQGVDSYVRLNRDGSPDLSFSHGAPYPGQVVAVARSADGRTFVAGRFLAVNGTLRMGLAAILPDGSLDSTFVPAVGIPWAAQAVVGPSNVTYPVSAQLAVLPDGSVLLAGTFNSVGPVGQSGVVHFLANGALDTSFNPTLNPGGFANAVATLPNGEWVIGGSFSTVNSVPRGNLAGFLSSGLFDPAFGANSSTNGPVTELLARPSGGVYVAGSFSQVGSTRTNSLAGLNSDGSIDGTFSATGLSAGTRIQSMASISDGRLMVAASTSSAAPLLLRLFPSGATDPSFVATSTSNNAATSFSIAAAQFMAVAVDANGKPIIGVNETYTTPSSGTSHYLIRFDTVGNQDPTFIANNQQANAPINCVAIGADGILAMGGEFSQFNGTGVLGLILIPKAAQTLSPPTITVPPQPETAVAGNSAVFSVSANGAATYQWQQQAAGSTTWTNLTDGTNYTGTSTGTLTVKSVTSAMNGDSFRCIITNGSGSVTTTPVALSVTSAVSITTQPLSQTVTAGGSASFTVTASGVSPLTYQWQREAAGSTTWTNMNDSTTYSGTCTATLTVNSATVAMNGDLFRCVSSNGFGTDTSSAAALVVPAPLTVTTLAGQGRHTGGSDGAGASAQFNGPTDVAVDSTGNVYVADSNNCTIRKVTPAGVVSTVAGYAGVSGSVDGVGSAARFNYPTGVAVDGAGNVYVADTDNKTIRKITTAGVVTTVAGQTGVSGSIDGTGSAARFSWPSGLAVDATGNLYVADTMSHSLRKITSSGVVSTFAGAAGTAGSVDGAGTAARFFGLQGLAADGAGNLYVADTNNSTIRKIVISTGAVTTVAGLAGTSGAADGPGGLARFYYPSGVTVDGTGNLFVADTDNNTIREILPSGLVATIAGKAGVSGIGNADGSGGNALFWFPTGITADNAGNIYIADTDNETVRLGYFPAAPAITVQPQSQTVTAGNNVQFTVTASGKPTPTYQWSFNGAAISGATASTYSLASVQAGNAGNYTATVTNSSGSVTSNTATLAVNTPAPPPSGGGGGGGGGGAPSLWFYGALSLLMGMRKIFRRK